VKYDVYGIGNALLDIQMDIDVDFLKQHNIPKGLMTYVSQEDQTRLINLVGQKNIRQISSGGSVANSMIILQHFGGNGFFSCKIAQDEAGDQYHQEMVHAGLATNYNYQSRPQGETGRCIVKITPDADRTMSTNLGISATLSKDELHIESLKNSKYLYLEGYLTTSPLGHQAALTAKRLAKEHDVKTAITFSDPAIVTQFKPQFHELIDDGIDLVFCNEAEAKEFTGASTLEQAAEQLKTIAKTYVITIGPKGSLVFDGQTLITVPATEEKPIDTLGAGDMYAGAFLYGITNGMSWKQAGQLANLTSSKVVTIYGPRISKEDTHELLQQLREFAD
jgi:sugar/nucleoside kinase (ribokinase family)